jgi:hypothetical protein
MNRPRRPVRIKNAPKRAKADTSHMLAQDASGFTRNEWLETLLRVKYDQPKRYAREVSAGLQVTVERYEQLRAAHVRRVAA